ncbi:MAG: hypothetical protein HUJ63_06140 [Enterococcus sp.]|nr:hypothetical protein [Enterococcus sp.]
MASKFKKQADLSTKSLMVTELISEAPAEPEKPKKKPQKRKATGSGKADKPAEPVKQEIGTTLEEAKIQADRVKILLSLPVQYQEALKQEAKENHITLTKLINIILKEHIEK